MAAQSGKITANDKMAAEAISDAIKALGGEKNLDGIRSLVLTGTEKVFTSDVMMEIEIRILLPDNFLMISKRDVPGFGPSSVYRGVSKSEVRNAAFTGTGKVATAPFTPEDEINRYASMLMGALLKGDAVAPLTLTSVADASNRFSVANAAGVLCEIEFAPGEKYPLLVSYKNVVGRFMMQQTDNSMIGRIGPVSETVDSIMRFNDRAAVDGVMFPMTIVFESRGNVDREIRFEKIQINPKLTITDFDIPQ